MRLFPRTPMILMALAPLALAGAVAGNAAEATAATACPAWNGAQPVNPGGVTTLDNVAVVSSCDVWAVGSSSSTGHTLIEHWTGSSWATAPSPSTGFLSDISAASASDIWAVGNSSGTVIEHYDGTAWTQKPSPHSDDGSVLFAVDARNATDAWAGGYIAAGSLRNWLMLHWDGTNWNPAPLPATPSGNSEIIKVSADSATDAWAVAEGSGTDTPSLLHWDGSRWTPSTVTSPSGAVINSVTALSPTNAWAVGHYTSGGNEQTLTEHYDGTNWNPVSSPNPGQSNGLEDVAATSGSDIWAAGSSFTSPTEAALALHWNGSSWAAVTLPAGGVQATDANQESISAAATGQAWIVGWGGFHIHQTGPFAVPVPVVPDVTGQQASAASTALAAAGLTSTQNNVTNCSTSLSGQVLSTDPAAGQQAPFGQLVTLTVCSTTVITPTVTVPDVTGEDDASARSDITSAGLTVGTVTLKADCTVPRGQVISQSPAGGTSAPFGSSVNLTEATRSGRAVHQITPHFCTQ